MTTRLIENILEAERLGEELRDIRVFVVGKMTIDVGELEPGKLIRLHKGARPSDITTFYSSLECPF